jgi:YD repeat-containing protein
MKITRFGFGRLRCALAFGLCLSLILSTFLQSALSRGTAQKTGWTGAGAQENGNAKKVPPVPPRTGPPAGNLPNLDQIRHAQPVSVRAVEAIPSTMRSRHSPLEPRGGQRVSDRLPGRRRSHHARHASRRALSAMTATMPLTLAFSDDPLTSDVGIKAIHITELRDAIDQARSRAGLVLGSWTEAVATGVPVRASHITEMRSKLDEARAVLGYSTGGYTDPNLGAGYWIKAAHLQELRDRVREVVDVTSSDQYVANFLQWSLGRPPTGPESTYWTDIIRAAYPHGLSSMQLAMRELGMTVFESAEYAARNRNDHWYVYDLYKTFLMRDPEPEGWAFWEANCATNGREQVRRAFDESAEFANIVAALNASGSPSAAVSSLATARVDPFNQSGNQLQARDAEWGISLISLPGRAGLDLGLGLSYSSLVWTNSGPYMYFDADRASLSPGFHIGFPIIQDKFFDARVGKNVYLLTTAAGRRVELRQVGTSNVYESADSSYLQLINNGNLLLRTTDGASMTYSGTGINEYRCTSIQDRNGNYMLVNYDWRGDIQNVTDTLGRVITFNYDTNANLNSITQSWNGQTHTWASFGWDNLTMQPTVSGVVGTYGGEIMPVLKMVAFHDGTYTKFLYNGNGQVERITQYASDSNPATDNHPRNYTNFDYDSPTNDCPRLTATRVWAEHWTGLNGVPSEVITQFGVEGDKHTVSVAGDPNGTIYKEAYAGSADASWMHGLVKSSEVLAGGVQQKLSTIAWTQDNTNVNYKSNPRVIETNVYDSAGNRRRVTIDYSVAAYTQYGLPYFVREYAADATTILRETYTDYKLDPPYLDRRIIGLVAATHLVSNGYQAKVTYGYDDPARLSSQATTATMHDQSYHGSFTVRGNVTSVSRWDVTNMSTIIDSAKALTTYVNYNAAGSVVSTTDPASHTSQIAYADSFSDGNNGRNTFAYPTVLTDADGFSSTIQYNFDLGAKTRLEGPPPANQPNGLIQTFAYDDAARPQRVTTANTGAYTHFVYGPNYVKSYSSVNNVAANYSESDLYSITVFDGVGRSFTTTSNHPGSAGGYKLVNVIFDRMGRPFQQSNPTEVNSSWLPAGDDAVGVRYSVFDFDWQGRTTRKTHPDGAYTEASYAGCGCAGGEVVTLTDEVNRQQKVYSDVLGRNWKTEVMTSPDANNNRSVYSATVSVYNARDQVTHRRQYAGAAPVDASSTNANASCPTGNCQETTVTFDGYARVQSQHRPEQNAGAATVYAYNLDDAVQSVTDARGAIATYGYNNRHLVTSINHDAPGGITPVAPISVEYDAAGNRTSMSDGSGSASYTYDSLSRLQTETKAFNGLSGTHSLNYGYNLAGQLTNVTDPTNASIVYSHDSSGQVTSVTGSPYDTGGQSGVPYVEVSNYATDIQHRASGALKHFNYGNGLNFTATYDERLRPTDVEISGRPPAYGTPTVMKSQFQYYADSKPKYARDFLDERFDRAFSFDQVGGLKEAYSGSEARDYVNNTNSGPPTGPFRQSYQHNAFGNMTSRDNRFWSRTDSFAATYENNRRQHPDFHYDAAGNLTQDTDLQYSYDAAGRNASIFSAASNKTITPTYDGAGQPVRRTETENGVTTTTYYVWSSVLGKVVTELNGTGAKLTTYVYLSGQVLARQQPNWVVWQHDNPITGSRGISNRDGGYSPEMEPDPMGVDVGFFDPFIEIIQPPPPNEFGPIAPMLTGDQSGCGSNPNCTRCYLDGFEIGCAEAFHLMDIGAAEFHTSTTVYVTYTSGRTETYTGYTNLPPGSFFSFTGDYARAAAFVFNVVNLFTGNFNAAVHTAIASADIVRNSRMDISGHAVGWYGTAQTRPSMQRPLYNGRQNGLEWTRDEKEKKDRAVDIALRALASSAACQDLFRAANDVMLTSPDPYDVLKGMSERSAGFLNRSQTRPVSGDGKWETIAWTRMLNGVPLTEPAVDLYNGFFRDRREFGLSADQTRALTILHELGHVMSKYFHKSLGEILGGKTVSDEELDRLIFEKCFGTGTPPPKGVTE